MISAQIDELRKWADQLSERENEFGVVVRALVAALRDAADTIWQLRDDLQRTHDAVRDAEHDESRAWDRVRKAEAEADRLREFARDMWCMTTFCRGTSDAEIADMHRRMSELGFMENYGEEVDA
jgi:chromosome segregation ATPase